MLFEKGNYQPSNDLFKFLILSVLMIVGGFVYIMLKATNGGVMTLTDWLVLGIIGIGAGYFFFQTYRYRF
jgi:hypothetical protein